MRNTKRDYYEILGVPRDATLDEIKAAYRRLAKKYHPDVAEDKEEAERIFREINEAYQVLSDPEKRRLYDMYGHSAIDGSTTHHTSYNSYSSYDPLDLFASSLEDIVESLFGAFAESSFRSRRTHYLQDLSHLSKAQLYKLITSQLPPQDGSDVTVEVSLTLEEVLRGSTKEVRYKRGRRCEVCDGVGFTEDAVEVCPVCKGSGYIRRRMNTPFGVMITESKCHECGGSGFILSKLCPRCKGKRLERVEEVLTVEIPPGVRDGETIRVRGRGDEGVLGGRDGDLLVKVRYQPHPIFKPVGSDLHLTLKISYPEAILGATIEVPTLDGDVVELRVPPGTESGSEFRLEGLGLPTKTGARGSLVVQLEIDVPKRLSSEQRKLLERMKELFKVERRHPNIPERAARASKPSGNILDKLFKRRERRS